MLAYVFWHVADSANPARYEERLMAFHHALRRTKPDGFVRSAAYRIQNAPWLSETAGYEDWYEVEDWAALGVLNTAAEPAVHSGSLWFSKPRETSYPNFTAEVEALAVGCALWQRQMTLGPATEFCITGPEAQVRGLKLPPQWQARWIHRWPHC